MGYYVRVSTREAVKRGTPVQALDYISAGHDARRNTGFSASRGAYITKMDPGWKADLKGGRVRLVRFGQLAAHVDHHRLAQEIRRSMSSDDLKIASPIRVHFAAHHGVLTPVLHRVRIDLAKPAGARRGMR